MWKAHERKQSFWKKQNKATVYAWEDQERQGELSSVLDHKGLSRRNSSGPVQWKGPYSVERNSPGPVPLTEQHVQMQ